MGLKVCFSYDKVFITWIGVEVVGEWRENEGDVGKQTDEGQCARQNQEQHHHVSPAPDHVKKKKEKKQ